MSQQTSSPRSLERTEIIGLLKRVAKRLKKSNPDRQLLVFQDEIAHSFGFLNWSLLHKNAFEMTESRFSDFAALVLQNADVQKFFPLQSKVVTLRRIKCTLFSRNIGYLAEEFTDGDTQAVVLADSNKIKAVMESSFVYYYGAEKIRMHKRYLENGFYEVPLVAARNSRLHWIEGFHQVNAVIEEGMKIVPIGTSLTLAQELKSLVGASDCEALATHMFDFSGCTATVV